MRLDGETIRIGVLEDTPELVTIDLLDIDFRIQLPVESAMEIADAIRFCATAIKTGTLVTKGNA